MFVAQVMRDAATSGAQDRRLIAFSAQNPEFGGRVAKTLQAVNVARNGPHHSHLAQGEKMTTKFRKVLVSALTLGIPALTFAAAPVQLAPSFGAVSAWANGDHPGESGPNGPGNGNGGGSADGGGNGNPGKSGPGNS